MTYINRIANLSTHSSIHTYIHTIHTSNLVQAQLSSKSPSRFEYFKWCREQGVDPSQFEFLFEVHVLGITWANRCFNYLQEGFLKFNWEVRELEESVSAYKVHTCHAYINIHLDLYYDYDGPIYSYISQAIRKRKLKCSTV